MFMYWNPALFNIARCFSMRDVLIEQCCSCGGCTCVCLLNAACINVIAACGLRHAESSAWRMMRWWSPPMSSQHDLCMIAWFDVCLCVVFFVFFFAALFLCLLLWLFQCLFLCVFVWFSVSLLVSEIVSFFVFWLHTHVLCVCSWDLLDKMRSGRLCVCIFRDKLFAKAVYNAHCLPTLPCSCLCHMRLIMYMDVVHTQTNRDRQIFLRFVRFVRFVSFFRFVLSD
jgi:hypothetical protein